MRTSSILVAAVVLAWPKPASAQFFTPLPAPADSKLVVKEDYAYSLFSSLTDRRALAVRALLADKPRLQAAIDAFCGKRNKDRQTECKEALDADSLIARGDIVLPPRHVQYQENYARGLFKSIKHRDSLAMKTVLKDKDTLTARIQAFCDTKKDRASDCKTALVADTLMAHGTVLPPMFHSRRLPFALPFSKRDERNHAVLQAYLDSSHVTTSLAVLNQFAANVSNKTAYVTTDVISGSTLGTLFSIQYAAVVVKDSNQVPDRRHAVEDNTATTMRMINNGGTVTARILYPFWSNGGTNIQQAFSMYGQVGVVGPTGNSDSLRLSGSLVFELMNGIAIRSLGGADVNGELIIGLRGGLALSEDELIASTKRHRLPFAQLGVGLRQSGTLGLSLLYTYLGHNTVFRPYYPKFLVNFTALR
jgi:hypothetical protein